MKVFFKGINFEMGEWALPDDLLLKEADYLTGVMGIQPGKSKDC